MIIMLFNKFPAAASILLLIFGQFAFAENFKTGTYTSFEYYEESGDVLGIEIFIIPSDKEDWVVFQTSEGYPEAPIIVPAKIFDNVITFELPDSSSYSGRFVGEFLDGYLIGKFENSALTPSGDKFFRLRYNPSFWQKNSASPNCAKSMSDLP